MFTFALFTKLAILFALEAILVLQPTHTADQKRKVSLTVLVMWLAEEGRLGLLMCEGDLCARQFRNPGCAVLLWCSCCYPCAQEAGWECVIPIFPRLSRGILYNAS